MTGIRTVVALAFAVLLALHTVPTYGQPSSRTLVAVFAHADDETSVAPVLARYAREGARVHLIIATDGAQGGSNTSVSRGVELAKVRSEEARCAAAALGIQKPELACVEPRRGRCGREHDLRSYPADGTLTRSWLGTTSVTRLKAPGYFVASETRGRKST